MNNAEMRSRLTYLGLSLRQLSTLEGWDYRELRRQANGVVALTRRTVDKIEELERVATRDLEQMLEAVDQGEAVVIPHFSDEGIAPYSTESGRMPGSYWHALAGRARNVLVERATEDPEAMTVTYSGESREG